jgi:hypothetical protein
MVPRPPDANVGLHGCAPRDSAQIFPVR